METLQPLQPRQKAIEIWHTFFKKEVHSFFSAKDGSLTLVDTYINESKYGNHLEAVTYWEKVKKAVKDL
jgi:hypothetical protein